VVLKVRSLEPDVDVEAVGGASVEAASEINVGKLSGVVSDVERELMEWALFPMVFMTCADLVGSMSTSLRVTGENSALRTEWKDMYTRSR
jgi:hypothetical protein